METVYYNISRSANHFAGAAPVARIVVTRRGRHEAHIAAVAVIGYFLYSSIACWSIS
jgi:hypothetical protein